MGKVDFHKCNERLRDGGIFTTEHTEAAFAGTESDLGKGTETAIQSLNCPSAAASDLSTFRHELDFAVSFYDPLPLAKSSNRPRLVFENRKHEKLLQKPVKKQLLNPCLSGSSVVE